MASVFMSFIHEDVHETNFVRGFIHAALSSAIDSFMSSDQAIIYAGEDWMGRISAGSVSEGQDDALESSRGNNIHRMFQYQPLAGSNMVSEVHQV
jgi:hypothetical protein